MTEPTAKPLRFRFVRLSRWNPEPLLLAAGCVLALPWLMTLRALQELYDPKCRGAPGVPHAIWLMAAGVALALTLVAYVRAKKLEHQALALALVVIALGHAGVGAYAIARPGRAPLREPRWEPPDLCRVMPLPRVAER